MQLSLSGARRFRPSAQRPSSALTPHPEPGAIVIDRPALGFCVLLNGDGSHTLLTRLSTGEDRCYLVPAGVVL